MKRSEAIEQFRAKIQAAMIEKYRTVIEDGAFIGSNVNLIAPVHIGKNALLAAGSTITEDVPDGDMGIARVRQSNKEGYGSKYLKK